MKINISKVVLMGVLAASAAMCLADTEKTTPTAWRWLDNVSEATIDEFVSDGYRLSDLEINDTSPYRFAGTMVRNVGSYHKDWAWRYNRTEAQLNNFLVANNMRILDLEVKHAGVQARFAAVMIANTGTDAAQWQYVVDRPIQWIDNLVEVTGSRLIDLDSEVVNGQRLWSAVLVRNTGSQYRNWWWYSNVSGNEIRAKMAQHDAYVVDVEPRGNGMFSVVLQAKPRTGSSWYVHGVSRNVLRSFYNQRKGRIIDLERVESNGNSVYYASILDNTNEIEGRVRDMALGQTDGTFGFYFREMNGATKAEINGDYRFYPASTIKILEHVFSMRLNGLQSPQVPLWPNSTANVHSTPPMPPTESLATMQTQMMVNSNNQRTNCIQDFYGRVFGNPLTMYFGDQGRLRMNQFAWNFIGTSQNLVLNHKFGAGGPANNPANGGTLEDFGILYEKFGSGALMPPAATLTAYSRMLWNKGPNNSHGFFNAVNAVVNQEAAAIGLSGPALQQFRNAINIMFKPGNFTTGSNIQYVSIAGMIYLPFKNGNVVSSRGYVFGSFIDAYTFANISIAGNGTPQITVEPMRDEIRLAAESFL